MMLNSGLDGVKNKLKPANSVDHDIFEMTDKEMKDLGILNMPGSLAEG